MMAVILLVLVSPFHFHSGTETKANNIKQMPNAKQQRYDLHSLRVVGWKIRSQLLEKL